MRARVSLKCGDNPRNPTLIFTNFENTYYENKTRQITYNYLSLYFFLFFLASQKSYPIRKCVPDCYLCRLQRRLLCSAHGFYRAALRRSRVGKGGVFAERRGSAHLERRESRASLFAHDSGLPTWRSRVSLVLNLKLLSFISL